MSFVLVSVLVAFCVDDGFSDIRGLDHKAAVGKSTKFWESVVDKLDFGFSSHELR